MTLRYACWLYIQRRLTTAEHMLETAKLVATMGNSQTAISIFRDYIGLSDPTMEIDIRGAVTKVNEVMGDIEAGRLKFLFEPDKNQIREARIRDFKKKPPTKKP